MEERMEGRSAMCSRMRCLSHTKKKKKEKKREKEGERGLLKLFRVILMFFFLFNLLARGDTDRNGCFLFGFYLILFLS